MKSLASAPLDGRPPGRRGGRGGVRDRRRRSLDLIQVDGSLVTVKATFTDEHTGATADGRVVVDCS